jgi:aminoglycoside phosphotransferase (APT) family kinase protein
MNGQSEQKELEGYLSAGFGRPVRVRDVEPLGGEAGEKGFGYGTPLRVRIEGAPVDEIVVHTVGTGGFGHDTLADRAAAAVQAFETFNNLKHHVRALDVGAICTEGRLVSLSEARDYFVITEYSSGEPYFHDLDRIARTGAALRADLHRAERLATYLAEIHAERHSAPTLFARRTRELFGHHECILGLLDSYDGHSLEPFTSSAQLQEIERRCVDWRHRLKGFPHRLCRVHGDFHPWNVLWGADGQFTLLDRSRGEWGEAADDVSCMAINYLFFSLRANGQFQQPLRGLWDRFFQTYMAATRDDEMMRVIPPYFVWRALVLASPVWYPSLDDRVRRTLFGFIDRLLALEEFDWRYVDTLLELSDGISREG